MSQIQLGILAMVLVISFLISTIPLRRKRKEETELMMQNHHRSALTKMIRRSAISKARGESEQQSSTR